MNEKVKENSGAPSAKLTAQVMSSLNVEVRVREQALDDGIAVSPRAAAVAREWFIRLAVLSAVLTISALYVGYHLGRGWVPADDGTLGQSALRVMQGQLPHRDFTEIYTGGLSMIHALAFRAFGVNLMSLRFCVFLFFLAWIPAVYYIVLRFTSALAAGLVTLLAIAWSFPNYPAAMPSWYNLFFATFGAAALLRYIDARKARWLVAAGMCGGVSIVIKVIGAYYIAAVLLFLVFLEQSDEQSERESDATGKGVVPYRIFTASALILFLATVIYFFHSRLGGGELFQFILPAAALTALVLINERNLSARGGSTAARFKNLLKLLLPFISGVLLPVIAFLAPYGRAGGIAQFGSGVTSSAISHSIALGVLRPAGIENSLFALVLIGIVAAAIYMRAFQGKLVSAAIASGLAFMLYQAATSPKIASGIWYSVATLTPLVVLASVAVILAKRNPNDATRLQTQRVMALTSLAAMCGMVQYPFAAPIYLCYTLPLTLLAAAAIIATAKKHPGKYVLSAVAGFYLLFGVAILVPDHIYELTHKMGPLDELRLERAGGLRIEYAAGFGDFIHFLQQHSPNGLMYAGNDCPELYFLSGLKNITADDGGAAAEQLLSALQSDNLNLVVINIAPFFPGARMGPEVMTEVTKRFPHNARFGIFQVFWKK